MCCGRTTVLSVEAPGLMKHLSVPGTRTETWPNMPMVPCQFSMRVRVAAFSRNKASSLIGRITPFCARGSQLLRLRHASALDQLAPAIDFRGEECLQLARRRAVDRNETEPLDQRLDGR